MAAAKYDIYAEQGTTFKLHLQYDSFVSLTGYNGEMQVRDTETDPKVYLYLSNRGVTGGGVTGDFDPTLGQGIAGVGGLSFNTGVDGTPGVSGGILIRIDKTTMSNIPAKKYFYDLKLTNTNNEASRIIEGVFEVNRQITR